MRLGLSEAIWFVVDQDCSAECGATVALRCLQHFGFGIVGFGRWYCDSYEMTFTNGLRGLSRRRWGIGRLLARQLPRMDISRPLTQADDGRPGAVSHVFSG